MERKAFNDVICVVLVSVLVIGAGLAVQRTLAGGPLQVSQKALQECGYKRELGELKSNADVAECSNAAMMRAYQAANSEYMPLIQRIAAKRLEVARRLDKGEIDEAQAADELTRFSDMAIARYAVTEHGGNQ